MKNLRRSFRLRPDVVGVLAEFAKNHRESEAAAVERLMDNVARSSPPD